MAKLIDKNNLTTLSASFSLVRTSPQPTDPTSVWYSYIDAETYAKTDNAYVGQHLTVVENGEVSEYVIADEDGRLVSSNVADDLFRSIGTPGLTFKNEQILNFTGFDIGGSDENAINLTSRYVTPYTSRLNPFRYIGRNDEYSKITFAENDANIIGDVIYIPPFAGGYPVFGVAYAYNESEISFNPKYPKRIVLPPTVRSFVANFEKNPPIVEVAGNCGNSFHQCVFYCKSKITLSAGPDALTYNLVTFYDKKYLEMLIFPFDMDESALSSFTILSYTKGDFNPCDIILYLANPRDYVNDLTWRPLNGDLYGVSPAKFLGCKSIKNVLIKSGFKIICNRAFAACYNLEGVVLPSTLEEIETLAFENCKKLANISIPQNVTKIADDAFSGCSISLVFDMTEEKAKELFADGFKNNFGASEITYQFKQEVSIKQSYSAHLEKNEILFSELKYNALLNGNSALASYVGNLRELRIPYVSGAGIFVQCISAFVFKNNDRLRTVEFPYTLCGGDIAKYYRGMFSGCHSLNTIKFYEDKDVKVIAPQFFAEGNCFLRRNGGLNDPEDATEFYHSVVAGCAGSVIPESANLIEPYAFHNLNSIEKLNIPSNIKKISDYAFAECVNLTDLTISEGVEVIGDSFQNCTSLNKVTLPSTITEMGSYMFDGCNNISVINVNWKKDDSRNAYAPWGATNATVVFSEDEVVADTIINGIIYQLLKDDEGNKYYCVSGVDPITVTSPSVDLESEISGVPVTTVGAYAFAKNLSSEDGRITIDEIICPDSVVKIMEYAFAGFNGIIGIRASGMSYLGEYCFNSAKLTVGLMHGDTLGTQFYNFPDTGVEKIYVSSSPTRIPGYAFANVKTLRTIEFRTKSVTEISDYAFASCTLLKSITGLVNVKSIGSHAFYDCGNLLTIDISKNSLKTVGDYAFYWCYKVPFDLALKTVGDYAFYKCEALTTVNATTCTSIGEFAFARCSNLSEFYMDVNEFDGGNNYQNGTSIRFGNSWDSETGDYTVIFPDGSEITKSQFMLSSEYSLT